MVEKCPLLTKTYAGQTSALLDRNLPSFSLQY